MRQEVDQFTCTVTSGFNQVGDAAIEVLEGLVWFMTARE